MKSESARKLEARLTAFIENLGQSQTVSGSDPRLSEELNALEQELQSSEIDTADKMVGITRELLFGSLLQGMILGIAGGIASLAALATGDSNALLFSLTISGLSFLVIGIVALLGAGLDLRPRLRDGRPLDGQTGVLRRRLARPRGDPPLRDAGDSERPRGDRARLPVSARGHPAHRRSIRARPRPARRARGGAARALPGNARSRPARPPRGAGRRRLRGGQGGEPPQATRKGCRGDARGTHAKKPNSGPRWSCTPRAARS
jgi:hypothetical protein